MNVRIGLMALLVSLSVTACENKTTTGENTHDHGPAITKAICVLTPTAGNRVRGQVTFTQTMDGVKIEGTFSNLTPGNHGFHVHEFGDISGQDGKSAGGHFNPQGHDHSLPDSAVRHVGDLGNLIADDAGNATYSRVDKVIKLTGAHSIIGRGMIVHAKPDDGGQPTGNAGPRAAMGVIGIAK
ncbi:MAG: superoxide dismutase family protein [Planctomycetota bacterium]|jgi:Cu-Zn family superoxide dismutase